MGGGPSRSVVLSYGCEEVRVKEVSLHMFPEGIDRGAISVEVND